MFRKLTFLLLLAAAHESKGNCDVKDVKTLLRGCSVLSGLKVVSTGGTKVDDTNCDIIVPKENFASEPLLQFDEADVNTFYTIVMVDPDAPNHPVGQFFLHMIKSNVAGADLKQYKNGIIRGDDYSGKIINLNKIGRTNIVTRYLKLNVHLYVTDQLLNEWTDFDEMCCACLAYRKPGPPRGTGAHRYMWLLYEQREGDGFAPAVPAARANFALGLWLSGNSLCGPVAATQFRARF